MKRNPGQLTLDLQGEQKQTAPPPQQTTQFRDRRLDRSLKQGTSGKPQKPIAALYSGSIGTDRAAGRDN